MDGKSGWYSAHKVGDLIKIVDKRINLDDRDSRNGDLGVVTKTPQEHTGILFIEAYMFRTGKVRWFSASELDIISNIDE
jgi:hypothetical protein